MAICTVNTKQRRIDPGVFNLKQFLNGTEQMIWEFTDTELYDGEDSLLNYDAFLVLSMGGKIDEASATCFTF